MGDLITDPAISDYFSSNCLCYWLKRCFVPKMIPLLSVGFIVWLLIFCGELDAGCFGWPGTESWVLFAVGLLTRRLGRRLLWSHTLSAPSWEQMCLSLVSCRNCVPCWSIPIQTVHDCGAKPTCVEIFVPPRKGPFYSAFSVDNRIMPFQHHGWNGTRYGTMCQTACDVQFHMLLSLFTSYAKWSN